MRTFAFLARLASVGHGHRANVVVIVVVDDGAVSVGGFVASVALALSEDGLGFRV